tara:strand:- start:388 stop:642 length:255 start_codon:yes stop_codon:yes gene_type:complete
LDWRVEDNDDEAGTAGTEVEACARLCPMEGCAELNAVVEAVDAMAAMEAAEEEVEEEEEAVSVLVLVLVLVRVLVLLFGLFLKY